MIKSFYESLIACRITSKPELSNMGAIKIQKKIEFLHYAIFQALDSHLWLVAIILDNANIEHFHP